MDGGDGHSLLEALYAGAPVGLAFWDTGLRYRRVNPKLAEINRLSPAEHLGRTPAEVLGEVGEQMETLLRGVLETHEPIAETVLSGELPAAPGVLRHRQASYFPVLAADGTTLGIGGVVIDVTDRVEAARRERAALGEAETARARAEALARASTALTSSIRTDRVLTELVRAVVPSLADFCAIHLARPGGRIEPIAVACADPAQEAVAHALAERQGADPDARVGAAAVIRTGRPEINAEITSEDLVREQVDPEERRLLAELEMRSTAILPLAARGVVLGSLTLVMGSSGRRYDSELVELAESLAAGAALALDNARLFAEQVDVARAFQSALLPAELPPVPGTQLAARYRAAGRSNQVGGDFYDVFEGQAGEWAVVIGDVVGKGPEAAAITSLVRATLQAAVLRGDDADAALRLVDDALRRRPAVQFCSAVHGRLRPVAGGGVDVQLLAAGHPPPLVLRRDGALEVVEIKGTLLGVAPAPSFGAIEIHLAPGDALLLYTDGATELRGSDPWRGEAALRDTVLASTGVSMAELVERVEHQALILSGGELRDDLALLAVGADLPGLQ
jgi:serine phosphatase RsbU (regulator of sigma subunit)